MQHLLKPSFSVQSILRKRATKIKKTQAIPDYPNGSEPAPIKNPNKTDQSRKKKSKIKEEDNNSLQSNIYHYFTNNSKKIDEIHMKQKEANKDSNKKFLSTDKCNFDEFKYLTEVELTEIKQNYQDFMIGDYLMIFPNPDFVNNKKQPVTYKEALEIYDKALTGKSHETMNKLSILKEKLAFIQAFDSLDDYEELEGEDEVNNREIESPQKKKKKKKLTCSQYFSNLFKRKKKPVVTIPAEITIKKDEKNKKPSFFTKCSKCLKRKPKKPINGINGQGTLENKESERNALKSNVYNAKGNNTKLTDDEKLLLKKTSDLEKHIKELKAVFKKMKNITEVKKKYNLGGFLKYRHREYECKNGPAKDFLTLIRNVVLTKLTMISKMHARYFLSSTGKHIIMILKCDENVLKKHANMIGLSKQMELGACDLMSLEPVDDLLRPYRLKDFLKMDENEYKDSLQYLYDERMAKDLKEEVKTEEEFKLFESAIKEMVKESAIDKTVEDQRYLIDKTCKWIYKRINKLNGHQFRDLIMKKNDKINEGLNELVKNYNIEVPDINTEIQDDLVIQRKHKEIYFLYLCYLEKYFHYLKTDLINNEFVQENILFLLKLIFRKAIGEANQIYKEFNKPNFLLEFFGFQKNNSLQTIWSKLQMTPSPPFSKYFISGKGTKSTSKNKANLPKKNLWRTYEINDRYERSIFLNMEKMKVINDIILKNINMVYMIKHLYIDSYFPLHNNYELHFETVRVRVLFNPLVTAKLIEDIDRKKNPKFLQLTNLFDSLAKQAESTDFNSDGSCFDVETAFNIKYPWYLNIETIRNYFGEKIAIYFSFLSFYTLEMSPMAFLGFIAQILIYADVQSDAIKLSFSILVIVWSTIFIEMWKRRQYMFAVKYGQLDFQEEESERPDFKGEYTRNIVDDNLNLTYFNSNKKKIKMIISFSVSLLMIGTVIFSVYGIFYLKSLAYCYKTIDSVCFEMPNNDLIQTLLTLLNTLQIQVFNKIYANVALKLNNYENHKLFSSYENSLVLKIFFFNFVNTFFSLIFVAFFNSVFPFLNLCKINDNCYDSLSRQMMIIFLTFFANNVLEIFKPFFNNWLNQRAATKDVNKYLSNKYVLVSMDQEVENDYMKQNYHPSQEIDGTVDDYMEMIMQFGFLNLFGMSFPLAFTLAFINDIAEIQVDKMKLVKFTRRPIPKGAANIGTWLIILDLISFFAIFFNTGLIIITAQVANGSNISILFMFVMLLLIFLGLKYIIRFLIPDVPLKAKILTERHKHVIERCNKELEINKNVTYIPCKGNNKIENIDEFCENQEKNNNNFNNINVFDNKMKVKQSIYLNKVELDDIIKKDS